MLKTRISSSNITSPAKEIRRSRQPRPIWSHARPTSLSSLALRPPPPAKRATATFPIVFVPAGDPVRRGLVASLAWPGGNVTGLSLYASEVTEETA